MLRFSAVLLMLSRDSFATTPNSRKTESICSSGWLTSLTRSNKDHSGFVVHLGGTFPIHLCGVGEHQLF